MKNLKKIFTVTLGLILMAGVAGCKQKEPVNPTPTYDPDDIDIGNAKDYLYQQMKNVTETTETYDLPVVNIAEVPYEITWTLVVKQGGDTNAAKLEGNKVVIKCEEGCPTVETEYTLSYTMKDPLGNKETGSFERKVPTFVTSIAWSELKQMLDDKKVESGKVYPFKGIVTNKSPLSTGICKNIYVENETGVVVIYNAQLTQEEFDAIKIGSTVRAVGTLELYYDAVEIKTPTITVYPDAVVAPEAHNIDAVFETATTTTDAAFAPYVNKYVEVTAATFKNYSTSDNYAYFKKGTITEMYARLSSSGSYAMNTDKEDPNCDYTLLANKWVMGHEATIKGLLLTYNGVYYIQPATANYVTVTNTTVTDEAKCGFAAEIAGNDFEKSIAVTKQWTLPKNSTGNGLEEVALAFEVIEGTDVASIAKDPTTGNDILTINVEKEANVKIKVTATLGTANAEETFTISTILPEPITVKAFLEAKDTENLQFVRGFVVSANSYVEKYACKTAGTYNTKEYAVGADATIDEFVAMTELEQANFEKVYKTGSFVLADATGAVFSYNKFGLEVGDEVMISTKYALSNDTFIQSNTVAVLKTYTRGATYTGELVKTYDNAAIESLGEDLAACTVAEDAAATKANKAAFGANICGKLVKVTGYAKVNSDNIELYTSNETKNNSTKIAKAWANPTILAQIKAAADESKEVDIYGYVRAFYSASGTSHANVQLNLVAGDETGFEFTPKGFTIDKSPIALTGASLLGYSGSDIGYNASENPVKVGTMSFAWTEIGAYKSTDGAFQFRTKSGKTACLWNTTAAVDDIESVSFVWAAKKDIYANSPILKVEFAKNANFTDAVTVSLNSEAGVKSYTVDAPAAGYTFVRITHAMSNSGYWDSITINLE